MKTFADTLQYRYTAILESDSDRSFYQNVHRYIHFIVKTPVLAKIIDESEQEYRQKHADIWKEYKHTDEEIDMQVERTRKLELLNCIRLVVAVSKKYQKYYMVRV